MRQNLCYEVELIAQNREPRMNQRCKVEIIVRTIGAERGRAARGGPVWF